MCSRIINPEEQNMVDIVLEKPYLLFSLLDDYIPTFDEFGSVPQRTSLLIFFFIFVFGELGKVIKFKGR